MPDQPHHHLGSLTAAEAASTSPAVAGWIGADALAANVLAELRRVVDGGPLSPAVPLRWHDARMLDLPDDRRCLAALSLAGEDAGEPSFVALYGLRTAGMAPASLREIARQASSAFPGAAAAQVRIFVPAGRPEDGPHAEPWLIAGKRLFALPAAVMQSLPLPRGAERVIAEPASDLDFYDEYADHYLAWQRGRPELAAHVRVEPREALEAHRRDGLLSLLRIDGRIGGVMAAHTWTECGLRGYRIAEEFLYPAFRGQGLAAAAQRRFVDTLDSTGNPIVYGWIHPLNATSMRTAARAGRHQIGGHFFVRVIPPA